MAKKLGNKKAGMGTGAVRQGGPGKKPAKPFASSGEPDGDEGGTVAFKRGGKVQACKRGGKIQAPKAKDKAKGK